MNIKSLISTSVIALISASAAQAADVIIPHETVPAAVITAPSFSWTGFYVGAQIGNFSSKTKITDPKDTTRIFLKDVTPKPSGFIGGLYAGSNVDLGSGLILGVETDAVWADREEAKKDTIVLTATQAADFNDALKDVKGFKQFNGGDVVTESYSYKEKWSGATRVRIGFTVSERFMPYIAGGIAYAQVQGIQSVSGQGEVQQPENNTQKASIQTVSDSDTSHLPPPGFPVDPDEDENPTTGNGVDPQGNVDQPSSGNHTPSAPAVATVGNTWADETKTMVGFTIGGGVDFAVTDNVLLRAEYRYSDFGKKKFANERREFSYKTNDFRVGIAYKF